MFLKGYSGKQLYISAEIATDGYYHRQVGLLRHQNRENYLPFALRNYEAYTKSESSMPVLSGQSHILEESKSSSQYKTPYLKGLCCSKLSRSNT
jgi:hypothetical protein